MSAIDCIIPLVHGNRRRPNQKSLKFLEQHVQAQYVENIEDYATFREQCNWNMIRKDMRIYIWAILIPNPLELEIILCHFFVLDNWW